MAHLILRTSPDRYAVFSTIVDGLVTYDMTLPEFLAWRCSREAARELDYLTQEGRPVVLPRKRAKQALQTARRTLKACLKDEADPERIAGLSHDLAAVESALETLPPNNEYLETPDCAFDAEALHAFMARMFSTPVPRSDSPYSDLPLQ